MGAARESHGIARLRLQTAEETSHYQGFGRGSLKVSRMVDSAAPGRHFHGELADEDIIDAVQLIGYFNYSNRVKLKVPPIEASAWFADAGGQGELQWGEQAQRQLRCQMR